LFPLSIGLVIETKLIWDDIQSSVADLPVRVVLEQNEIPDLAAFLTKIERMRPDVLLLEVTNLKDRLQEVVPKIRAITGAPVIFALHKSADSDVILSVLRSGANEYLFPPLKQPLRDALERVSAERNRDHQSVRPGGRTLGFLSVKGGCGATTIACHTASALAARTRRQVLLADFDIDAGMVGFVMKAKSPYSVLDALVNVHRLDPTYWHALVSNGTPNLEIITSPAPAALPEKVTPEQIRYVIRFSRTQYDWVVIDLGRGLTQFSYRAVEELDETFLVATPEVHALHQAKQAIQRLVDSGYARDRIRLLLNRAPKRFDITLDELQGMLGLPVYATIGNDYASLQESYTEGKLAAGNSQVARHIDELAAKIAGIEISKKKKFSLF
jgi:pilus assembly protein CpaE